MNIGQDAQTEDYPKIRVFETSEVFSKNFGVNFTDADKTSKVFETSGAFTKNFTGERTFGLSNGTCQVWFRKKQSYFRFFLTTFHKICHTRRMLETFMKTPEILTKIST